MRGGLKTEKKTKETHMCLHFVAKGLRTGFCHETDGLKYSNYKFDLFVCLSLYTLYGPVRRPDSDCTQAPYNSGDSEAQPGPSIGDFNALTAVKCDSLRHSLAIRPTLQWLINISYCN
jgi:hypothetical protein